ncbi:hypothetical protein PRIPAC_82113 [Pristionchus pacificus]|uniref:Uncharacterized protein n=1 Tax=Pristionchus pacificus TaxID=54126 RepID=A0A2A6CMG4_PRIPA|nr:hypothetical protein PRIPAC_82113 [Pristionchus pacificus]|eukprot:PDM79299.1 hypothetical protein PRIPAC_31878 [Pristionchus pacificus]
MRDKVVIEEWFMRYCIMKEVIHNSCVISTCQSSWHRLFAYCLAHSSNLSTMDSVRGIFGKISDLSESVTCSVWFQTPTMFGLPIKILTLVYILVFAAIDWLLLRVSYYHQSYRSFSGPMSQMTFVVELAILLVCIAAVVGVYGKKEKVLFIFECTISGCVAVIPILYVLYCVRVAKGTAEGTQDLSTLDMIYLYAILLMITGVFEYTSLHAIRVVDKLRREMSAGDGRRLVIENEPEFDRGWSFTVSLCMQLLGGIQLVSIQQLVEGLAQIAFSGAVGRIVDLRSERKYGMMMCLIGNNFSMIFTCVLFVLCLSLDRNRKPSVQFGHLCVMESFAHCRTDWALVLVNERGAMNRRLARTNAILTSLDQLANVLSPLFLGAILSFASLRTTCIILAAYSAISFILKGTLLITLYESHDRLKRKDENRVALIESDPNEISSSKSVSARLSSVFSVLSTYYAQPVYPAAVGLALLYMTCLGFNGLDIAYGESVGLPDNILGFFRSFGSVAGVAGALMYAVFERHFGVRRTGVIGMTLQASLLGLCVVSIWLPGSPWNPSAYFATLTWSSWWESFIGTFSSTHTSTNSTTHADAHIDWSTMTTSDGTSIVSIFTFLIAIAASRFGLWMADLAITHIMQINTHESHRNTVFGVQNAICQTFSVLKDALVIILPSPNTFGICILISYAFKLGGCFSYIYYILKSANTADKQMVDDKMRSYSKEEARKLSVTEYIDE